MSMKSVRVSLALGLIAIGVLMLEGCIFVPTFNRLTKGKDLSAAIDVPNTASAGSGTRPTDVSTRPSVQGRRTMAEVVAILGRPDYVSEEGRVIAYTWIRQQWFVVGLCNGPIRDHHALLLAFDDGGNLLDHQFTKQGFSAALPIGYDGPYLWAYRGTTMVKTPANWSVGQRGARNMATTTQLPATRPIEMNAATTRTSATQSQVTD